MVDCMIAAVALLGLRRRFGTRTPDNCPVVEPDTTTVMRGELEVSNADAVVVGTDQQAGVQPASGS
jgi:hypothetical protein